MARTPPRSLERTVSRPPIVGIGASAGGLTAIKLIFERLPVDTGAAFVVVQHLSLDFKSVMDEILARHTRMRIVRVEGRVTIEPDCVYLLQPGDEIAVDGNELRAEPFEDQDRVPFPVDTLFESMAVTTGPTPIAVVLSGTGSDGARGVALVKAAGGVVIVQNPDGAEFDGMPSSAIATGCVDHRLDPRAIADLIASLLTGGNGEVHRLACARARVPMLIVRRNGDVQWLNAAAAKLFRSSAPPRNVLELFATDEMRSSWRTQSRAVGNGTTADVAIEGEIELGPHTRRHCRLDLAGMALAGNPPELLACQLIDLSEQASRTAALTAIAEELESEATTDALTGLLNRRGANTAIQRITTHDGRRGERTMAILIDCDNFKSINDEFGYDCGDATLETIARRMRETLRPEDVCARVGGDEFLAVLSGTRLAEATHVGDRLRRAIAQTPIQWREQPVRATVSIGVVPLEAGQTSVERILSAAGATLKRSKTLGRNRVSSSPSDGQDSSGLPSLQRHLDDLLHDQRVRIVRQTLNDPASGNVVACEFLSRGPEPWTQPARLFDLFRRHGRIETIDLHCLRACLSAWRDALESDAPNDRGRGQPESVPAQAPARCHINLLPTSLTGDTWPAVLHTLATATAPERITLDLSEQQIIGPAQNLRSKVDQIRELGIRIAIDDISYGRSAFETLLALDPDVVKIDCGMIQGIDNDAGRRRALARLVQLARTVTEDLIAEGVETESQREQLCELGVPVAQGFLWSDPDRLD